MQFPRHVQPNMSRRATNINGFRRRTYTHPEEVFSGAGIEGSVQNITLLGQIIGRLDRRQHALDGEEGGQVSRVGRYDD